MIDTKPKERIYTGKKKLKLTAVRRLNQRFIQGLIQKIQEFIIYNEPASFLTE